MIDQKEIEIRELAANFDAYKAQLEQLARQEEVLRMSLEEHLRAKETMKRFGECKEETKMLIPIGANTFLHGKVSDKSKVILGVGGDVAIESTIEDALENIEVKIKELRDAEASVTKRREETNDRMVEISEKLQLAYQESRKGAVQPPG